MDDVLRELVAKMTEHPRRVLVSMPNNTVWLRDEEPPVGSGHEHPPRNVAAAVRAAVREGLM
jgi:hypothetical protein